MKIAIAQTCPVVGNIDANIVSHKSMIQLAAGNSADCIIFPELSITGYEPKRALDLAMKPDHPIFKDFQQLSNDAKISIGLGAPIRIKKGICIGMVLFSPKKDKQFYFKKYLHLDEEDFFVPGDNLQNVEICNTKIALAICYEISILEHTKKAFANTPDIFVASISKSKKGIEKALSTLSNMAKTYKTPVIMSNNIGWADGEECAGLSSVWDKNGNLLAQLSQDRGLLFFNTATGEVEILECK